MAKKQYEDQITSIQKLKDEFTGAQKEATDKTAKSATSRE
jgi:hypothetical protein